MLVSIVSLHHVAKVSASRHHWWPDTGPLDVYPLVTLLSRNTWRGPLRHRRELRRSIVVDVLVVVVLFLEKPRWARPSTWWGCSRPWTIDRAIYGRVATHGHFAESRSVTLKPCFHPQPIIRRCMLYFYVVIGNSRRTFDNPKIPIFFKLAHFFLLLFGSSGCKQPLNINVRFIVYKLYCTLI